MEVILQPWSDEDLSLIQKLMSDPDVMAYLGGPESLEQIKIRHQRYVHLSENGTDHMFKIAAGPKAEPLGKIGYWKKNWHDHFVYERRMSIRIPPRPHDDGQRLATDDQIYSG